MSDEQWDGIETRRDPKTVFAWRGTREAGTFQGSLRLDVDGDIAYVGDIYVEESVRRLGLATALVRTALSGLAGVRTVHAHLMGWEGQQFVESLRREFPEIDFVLTD